MAQFEYEVFCLALTDGGETPILEQGVDLAQINELGERGWQYCERVGIVHALFMREVGPAARPAKRRAATVPLMSERNFVRGM